MTTRTATSRAPRWYEDSALAAAGAWMPVEYPRYKSDLEFSRCTIFTAHDRLQAALVAGELTTSADEPVYLDAAALEAWEQSQEHPPY